MTEEKKSLNFIEHIIEEDLRNGMNSKNLRFRFPPEPNGYLHIGHTKAIGISFGLGLHYNAPVNLRFDDTNPAKEEQEYVDAIKKDIAWLGYQWDKECYSSDYFQQLYDWAVKLINEGKAYVDSQSAEVIAEQKGTTTEPGVNSPFRDRSVEENLDLFTKMKNGDFNEGEHVVRAKIDMADPNMLMRDPLMYRILKKSHHRTGDNWCIYPMYDWTHGESDYIESISHSLCSLEFKPHRKLYDWFLDQIYTQDIRPKQREFARLNLSYTIMSKRKLLKLVEEGIVSGWDDPRMPTISGLRRRGYTPASIRKFVETVGVAKRENVIDVSLLEFCVREDLNKIADRVMAVLDPVKLIITNYPEDEEEWLEAENNPEDEAAGFRKVPFSKELYIEREDFKEEAGRKFFRLTLGKEVRLKNAYIIKGENVVKDAAGNIIEIHCSYDPKSRSGSGSEESKRNVKGTLHWVSIKHAIPSEVRVYDRLFNDEAPDSHKDKEFMEFINPDSLKVIKGYVEPSMVDAKPLDQFQFQRLGYFNVDIDSTSEALVFNKTVGLRDTWAKIKPVQKQSNTSKQPQNKPNEVAAIDEIKRAGKKYTNLPDEKRELLKSKIQEAAKKVEIEELVPLYQTAAKKVGTRIATIVALDIVLQTKEIRPDDIAIEFISKAANDDNDLLKKEAIEILKKYNID
ncbi:glutamine--tRNA ligase/YqeY domain fusion protein [Aquimarina sp. 2201CG5-10]|uniref:glutamine--tRNA ligase/YqeY domain fusion protein n=1 Tax=Aquimarina callyspongiae TaxID=3098150 RepID=UPI002AB52E98|nr:glutamine--tRNA ligase/YqeY domain fusion protein [Aquimarina sp. 2201CG5-10]MDY8135318.1 glutamine--tRNA ligase/YqeY domain fusion protein [Aquimarina sp. 2201CG5-10]